MKLHEQSSNFESVKSPVKSSERVLDAVSSRQNVRDYRLLQVLYCRPMPNDLVSVFRIFVIEKLYRSHKS